MSSDIAAPRECFFNIRPHLKLAIWIKQIENEELLNLHFDPFIGIVIFFIELLEVPEFTISVLYFTVGVD